MQAIQYTENWKIYVPELTVAEYLEYQRMYAKALDDRYNFDRFYVDVMQRFARNENGNKSFGSDYHFDGLKAKEVMTAAMAFQKALQEVNDIKKEEVDGALLKN